MQSSRSARLVGLLLSICLVAVVAPLHVAELVQAGGTLWCKADPLVSLNGRVVDITVSVPLDYLLRVNGPTQIQIRTPAGVDRFVILNDLGFNLRGSTVTFVDGGVVTNEAFPVEIRVTVPMNLLPGEVAPMEVTVWPDNGLPTTVVATNVQTTVRMTIASQTVIADVTDSLLVGLN
jgi:hypothetical protein